MSVADQGTAAQETVRTRLATTRVHCTRVLGEDKVGSQAQSHPRRTNPTKKNSASGANVSAGEASPCTSTGGYCPGRLATSSQSRHCESPRTSARMPIRKDIGMLYWCMSLTVTRFIRCESLTEAGRRAFPEYQKVLPRSASSPIDIERKLCFPKVSVATRVRASKRRTIVTQQKLILDAVDRHGLRPSVISSPPDKV